MIDKEDATMSRNDNWYLVAYDICDPRRLQRVQRRLKREAMAVQKSVFFYQGSERDLKSLLDELAREMKLKVDDMRAWPVDKIQSTWMYGKGLQNTALLMPGRKSRLRDVWKRWVA